MMRITSTLLFAIVGVIGVMGYPQAEPEDQWRWSNVLGSKHVLGVMNMVRKYSIDTVLPKCSLPLLSNSKDWVIHTDNKLPDLCSIVRVCNTTVCLRIGIDAFLFSKLEEHPHTFSPSSIIFNTSAITFRNQHDRGTCALKPIHTRTRRAAQVDPPKKPWKTGLTFTIPWTRYCGPGTNFAEMEAAGGPLNKLDVACRQHDLAYEHAVTEETIWISDDQLVQAAQEFSTPIGYTFSAFFTAKRLYEMNFGSPYLNARSVCPINNGENGDRIMQYQDYVEPLKGADTSAYMKYERIWKENVETEWKEYCGQQDEKAWASIAKNYQCIKVFNLNSNSTHSYNGSPRTVPGNDDKPKGSAPDEESPPAAQKPTGPNVPPKQPDIPHSAPGDSLTTGPTRNPFPKAMLPCAVLIKSVRAGFKLQNLDSRTTLYIELGKFCPQSEKHNNMNDLSGYFLVTINPTTNELIKGISLQGQSLVNSPDNAANAIKLVSTFTIGVPPDSVEMFSSTSVLFSSINPIYIALLHYPTSRVNRNQPGKFLNQHGPLTIPHTQDLKGFAQDGILYGGTCNDDCEELMDTIIPDFSVYLNLLPSKDTREIADLDNDLSLNFCGSSISGFDHKEFILSRHSKGLANFCPETDSTLVDKSYRAPYAFVGKSIRRHAQQFLINVYYFCIRFGKPEAYREANCIDVAAHMVNMSPKWARKVRVFHEKNMELATPRRSKIRRRPVRDQIEGFEADGIRRIIIAFYEKNRAPFLNDVYKVFVESFPEITCSLSTFRKILRGLNFRYKRIDRRAVLVQNPVIVVRRHYYILYLDQNDQLPEEEKRILIYTDETWIDTTSRCGKGWMPNQFDSFRAQSKFSYKDTKSPSSPRLIVLAAADEEGIMPESIRVYPVKKGGANLDYHENVDSPKFLEYFENGICIPLSKRPGKFTVVMDNASYHSSSTAPLLNSKKQVLYDWLLTQQDKLTSPLPSYKDARVPMLKLLVRRLKLKHNYFKVEEIAAKYDIKILRLPPWNCDLNPIELVWKEVKDEVRKRNVGGSIDKLQEITVAALKNSRDSGNWPKYVAHVNRLREQYKKDDKVAEVIPTVSPIVIDPNAPDSDDDDNLDDDVVADEVEDLCSDMPVLYSALEQIPDTDIEYDMPTLDFYPTLVAEQQEFVLAGDWEVARAMEWSYDVQMNQYDKYQPPEVRLPKCSRALEYPPDEVQQFRTTLDTADQGDTSDTVGPSGGEEVDEDMDAYDN